MSLSVIEERILGGKDRETIYRKSLEDLKYEKNDFCVRRVGFMWIIGIIRLGIWDN